MATGLNTVRPPRTGSETVNALILFEDEHLLVVHKPSGINTHKPDRFAPDGIHEWLTRRKPQWRNLAILHRLDKDTSGLLVFGKSTRGNQSLTEQFTAHAIVKEYLLLATARPTRQRFHAKSTDAVTEFEFVGPHAGLFLVRAQPVTGKTHQIRRHASDNGFPIVGDALYGGEPAPRLMLHAHRIALKHPGTGEPITFEASVPRAFDELDPLIPAMEFRELLFNKQTTAFRLISGATDGFPDVVVDNYGGWLLVQWQTHDAQARSEQLVDALRTMANPSGIVEQVVTRNERSAPRMLWPTGNLPEKFAVRENGLTFWVRFGEGFSTGLFADQRENRWRLLSMDLRGKTALNCFAYTGAFSVAAAKAGATVTSVDLSRNYIEWERENFLANDITIDDSPASSGTNDDDKAMTGESGPKHDFIYGDVFDWLRRFRKHGRTWDIVLLDPPTFSRPKHGRAFRAERDYRDLAALAIPLVAADGWLFCSTNQRTLAPEKFERALHDAAQQCGRVVTVMEFQTAPFDYRLPPGEYPYLKTFWAQLR